MLYPNVFATPWNKDRWPFISPVEIACDHGNCKLCGGTVFIDEVTLDNFIKMRNLLGKSIKIERGHSCSEHNAAVGGAKKSAHLQLAIDMALGNYDRDVFARAAMDADFRHIGFMKFGLHVDMRSPELAARYWSYGPTSRDLWKYAWQSLQIKADDVHDIGGI